MTDPDREPIREPIRETHRTTVIDTGGRDRGSGAGGVIGLVLLLIIVAGVAWFLMRGGGTREATKVGVNLNMPKVEAPNINVKVPDKIEIKTDKSTSNTSR